MSKQSAAFGPVGESVTSHHPPLDEFNVGIICALAHEFASVEMMFDQNYGRPTLDTWSGSVTACTLGKMKGHNVVVALFPLDKMGISFATSAAKDLINMFRSLKSCMMVGIAGGIPSADHDIRLGDIVVSAKVQQYDLGKANTGGEYESKATLNAPSILLTGAAHIMKAREDYLDPQFLAYMEEALKKYPKATKKYARPGPETDHLFKTEYPHPTNAQNCDGCPVEWEERRDTRETHTPCVHYGTVASGNTVVKDSKFREKLRGSMHDPLCFEMESAGVMNYLPCLVIRGICDYSDSHKNDVWQPYAAFIAAAYAKEVLATTSPAEVSRQEVLVKISENLKALAEGVEDINDGVRGISDQLDRMSVNDREGELSKCHQSLKTSTYEKFKNLNFDPSPNTCLWVLRSKEYINWKYILWVSADPGCGKSVLAKKITEDIEAEGSRNICYFFFKDNELQNKLLTALCAILHQLFAQEPHLRHHALTAWNHSGLNLREEEAELWRIFLAATSDKFARPTVCVLDALDECRSDKEHKDREDLIQLLNAFHEVSFNSTKPAKLRFFVTSRPLADIISAFGPITTPRVTTSDGVSKTSPQIHLKGEEKNEELRVEIDNVVRIKVRKLALEKRLSVDIQMRYESEFLNMENRTYLWVHLAIQDLRERLKTSLSPDEEDIEPISSTVQEVYERTLDRIQDSKAAAAAMRAFRLLVGARRPLGAQELVMALRLADRPKLQNTPSSNLGYDAAVAVLRERCGLFIYVKDWTIHFIHQTAREFLLTPNHKYSTSLHDANELLADVCVRYLYMGNYDRNDNAFLYYSGMNWFYHTQQLSRHSAVLRTQILDLYKAHAAVWGSFIWQDILPWDHIPDPIFGASLAAYYGDSTALESLLSEDEALSNQADDTGNTALIWSSWSGEYAASKSLLDHNADVNAESRRYGTPLIIASSKGHRDIVQLLLDRGADINHHSGEVGRAHFAMATLKPEVRYLTAHTGTALWSACFNGHLVIVQILLQNEAQGLEFALMSAAYGGHLEIAKLLIKHGADINFGDEDGFYGTTLQAACQGGHLAMVRFLLDSGAEDKHLHGRFDNALQAAANFEHPEIISLLLKRGIQYEDNAVYTDAFITACSGGDLQTVTALQPLVADINEHNHRTALQAASRRGRTEIMLFLLEKGADITLHYPNGRYPDNLLQAAASRGDLRVVEKLIELVEQVEKEHTLKFGVCEVNTRRLINLGDAYGTSPLFAATCNGHLDVVKALVNKGADVNAQCGGSSVFEAAYERGPNVAIMDCLRLSGRFKPVPRFSHVKYI
ncbi:hypothetical protein BJX99DRAFT_264398 [Aspergillus californicus]